MPIETESLRCAFYIHRCLSSSILMIFKSFQTTTLLVEHPRYQELQTRLSLIVIRLFTRTIQIYGVQSSVLSTAFRLKLALLWAKDSCIVVYIHQIYILSNFYHSSSSSLPSSSANHALRHLTASARTLRFASSKHPSSFFTTGLR